MREVVRGHPWRTRSHEQYLLRLEEMRIQRERAEYERRCTAPRVKREGR